MIISTRDLAQEITDHLGQSPSDQDSGRLVYENPYLTLIVQLSVEKIYVSVSTPESTWKKVGVFNRDQEQSWVVSYLVGILL